MTATGVTAVARFGPVVASAMYAAGRLVKSPVVPTRYCRATCCTALSAPPSMSRSVVGDGDVDEAGGRGERQTRFGASAVPDPCRATTGSAMANSATPPVANVFGLAWLALTSTMTGSLATAPSAGRHRCSPDRRLGSRRRRARRTSRRPGDQPEVRPPWRSAASGAAVAAPVRRRPGDAVAATATAVTASAVHAPVRRRDLIAVNLGGLEARRWRFGDRWAAGRVGLMTTYLVGVDGSDHGRDALSWARRWRATTIPWSRPRLGRPDRHRIRDRPGRRRHRGGPLTIGGAR